MAEIFVALMLLPLVVVMFDILFEGNFRGIRRTLATSLDTLGQRAVAVAHLGRHTVQSVVSHTR